jgi:hypothetical protein
MIGQPGLVRHEAEFRAYAILQYEDIKLSMAGHGAKTGVAKSPEVSLSVGSKLGRHVLSRDGKA